MIHKLFRIVDLWRKYTLFFYKVVHFFSFFCIFAATLY